MDFVTTLNNGVRNVSKFLTIHLVLGINVNLHNRCLNVNLPDLLREAIEGNNLQF